MNIKKGDKVRFLNTDIRKKHSENYQYYPEAGTVGEVLTAYDDDSDILVQWPEGSTSQDDRWWCDKDDVEIVESA